MVCFMRPPTASSFFFFTERFRVVALACVCIASAVPPSSHLHASTSPSPRPHRHPPLPGAATTRTLRRREERRYSTIGYPAESQASDVIHTADKYDFLLLVRDAGVNQDDADDKEPEGIDEVSGFAAFTRGVGQSTTAAWSCPVPPSGWGLAFVPILGQ